MTRNELDREIVAKMREMHHPNCMVMNVNTGSVARWGDWMGEVADWFLGDDEADEVTGAMQMSAKDQLATLIRVRKNRAGEYVAV